MNLTRRSLALVFLFSGFSSADEAEDYFRFATTDRYAAQENLALRANGAQIWVRNAEAELSTNGILSDGLLGESPVLAMTGVPFEIGILLAKPERVSGVRLFHGMVSYAGNASGEVGILAWRLMADVEGRWIDVLPGIQTNRRFVASGATGPFTFHEARDFTSVLTDKLRLVVMASSDTGRRMSSTTLVAPERRVCYLREVEVYGPDRPRAVRELPLASVLEGDWVLPAYQNARSATLFLKLRPELKAPAALDVSFTHRHTGKSPIPSKTLSLKPGESNLLNVDLSGWPPGDYRTSIRSRGGSEAVRWLRLEKVPEAPAPAEPLSVAGSTLLFIDEHYLQAQQGFRFVPQVARQTPLVEAPMEGDRINQRGLGLWLETNGDLVGTYYGMERSALNPEGSIKEGMARKLYAARSRDGERWEKREGPYTPPVGAQYHASPEKPPPSLGKLAGGELFRFYDAKLDGVVPLSSVVLHFSGYQDSNYGPMKVPKGSIVPLWRKSSNLIVFLRAQPLLGMQWWSRAEPEDPGAWNGVNDNFGGQWMSADGRTLYFSMGRRVPRNPPYHIPYDNLPYGYRLMTVYATRNGLDWSHSFMCPPEESDPPGWQHYGFSSFPLEDGKLRMAYLYAYDCLAQQIYIDLAYTRNNLRWQRLRGAGPFAGNGPLGSWNFGFIFASGRHLVKDGRCYMQLNYNCNQPHFGYRYILRDQGGLNPGELQKMFTGLELEKWPFWKDLGNWENLYERMVKPACYTVGVLSFRQEGWVAAVCGEAQAMATTRLFVPGKHLSLNAKTLGDGEVSVEILDAKGQLLPGFSGPDAARFRGDQVRAPLSWKGATLGALKESPVRFRITARKAELYALVFEE